jgi:hypothetical protein
MVFERIKEALADYPDVIVRIENDYVTIDPVEQSGFPITVSWDGKEYMLGFGGWHNHFPDGDEVLKLVLLALSDRVRLKVVYRGEVVSSWTFEARDGGKWKTYGKEVLGYVPFWKKKRVEYKQNLVIRMGDGD